MKLILIVSLAVALMTGSVLAGSDTEETKSTEKAPAEETESTETASAEETVLVLMKTSMGDIVIELNAAKAPISVENFLHYVGQEGYDGTIFHRVISNFMIQGGGFKQDMTKVQTSDPIKNEWKNGLKNERGSIAMARTNQVDSATNQFFINVVDNRSLDGSSGGAGYAVFGMVVQGMDVVDQIRSVPTKSLPSGYRDVPAKSVVIESVRKIDALPEVESEG